MENHQQPSPQVTDITRKKLQNKPVWSCIDFEHRIEDLIINRSDNMVQSSTLLYRFILRLVQLHRVGGPTPEITDERCLVSSKICHDGNSMTACVQFSKTGPKELYLLIQNEGERALKVNVTISHIKIISQELQILEHQTEKIVISKNIGGSSLIVLNAGNEECIIDTGSLAWRHNFSKHLLFVPNLTPISVAYLLFSIAVIIGGTWACCKLKKNKRKFDGVAYEELEMGQPKSHSTRNMDTQDWDEGWDGEWDAEKLSEESSPDR